MNASDNNDDRVGLVPPRGAGVPNALNAGSGDPAYSAMRQAGVAWSTLPDKSGVPIFRGGAVDSQVMTFFC
jgi:hypothetical protein